MNRHFIITMVLLLGPALPVFAQYGSSYPQFGGPSYPQHGGPMVQDFGNLYVTGQVTGGHAFRGHVPYSGVGQLSLQLPSEMVDNFQRDSVGLRDLGPGGRVYGPQPFTAASKATYMMRTVTRDREPIDMTMRGVAAPVAPLAQPGTVAPVQPGAAFSPILSRGDIAAILSRTEPVTPPTIRQAVPSVVVPPVGERAGVSALFGMIQESQRRAIDEQRLGPKHPRFEPRPSVEERPDEPTPDADLREAPPAEEREARIHEPGALGADVFADLLVGLADRRDEPAGERTAVRGRAPSAELERLEVDPSERTAAQQSAAGLAGRFGRSASITRLGGHGTDRFNRLMAQGDQLLAEGRFYQAAARYENARVVMEHNPLPAMGAGLAYLGAGESYRASYYLRLSVRMFPELMQVRTDIDKLVGREALDRRLAELPEQLGEQGDPRNMPVLFLMTFIHANRGEMDDAAHWARRLLPLVEADPRLRAYARHFIPEPAPAEDAPVE